MGGSGQDHFIKRLRLGREKSTMGRVRTEVSLKTGWLAAIIQQHGSEYPSWGGASSQILGLGKH